MSCSGWGNPGSEYADTRHNVGWMVLDRILSADAPADVVHEPTMWARIRSFFSAHGPRGPWEKADGPYIQAQCSGDAGTREPFLLAKPLTYMNNSGEAARALADEYDLESSNILVIVDDVHLPLGEMRLRQKGSTGGHNGLASLHECLGTDAYPRLRIGGGRTAERDRYRGVRPRAFRGRRMGNHRGRDSTRCGYLESIWTGWVRPRGHGVQQVERPARRRWHRTVTPDLSHHRTND